MKTKLFFIVTFFFFFITTFGQSIKYPMWNGSQWVEAYIDANTSVSVSGSTMTGQAYAQLWWNKYNVWESQQKVANTSGGGNTTSGDPYVSQSNFNTLKMQEVQIKLEEEKVKTMKFERTLNGVSTVGNLLFSGIQTYNNTRITNMVVRSSYGNQYGYQNYNVGQSYSGSNYYQNNYYQGYGQFSPYQSGCMPAGYGMGVRTF
jgi:hypothetical protein